MGHIYIIFINLSYYLCYLRGLKTFLLATLAYNKFKKNSLSRLVQMARLGSEQCALFHLTLNYK